MSNKNTITGLILAGGRGTRMGTVDKGLMPFRTSTLIEHVLQALVPQVAGVVINANQNPERYRKLGWPLLADDMPGFHGPLAGLQTGLRHCATDYLLCVPCDSPFLPADLAARLADALEQQGADLALAVTLETGEAGWLYQQTHPVFCLMHKNVLPALDAYLRGGGRKMDGWHATLKVAQVLFDDASAFRNINTVDELKRYDTPFTTAGMDGGDLAVADAQRFINGYVEAVQAVEHVALRSALDRVLASDVLSPISVPAHDNSAMDGYALRGADLPAGAPVTLAIVATAYAGHPCTLPVEPGQCVRIMTGAVMPDGCDSVVPQELVARHDAANAASIILQPGTIRAGDNRRFKGEDLMQGQVALQRGTVMRPAHLGLLASLGIAEVAVKRRLRVAFFSTGDELRSIGEALDTGSVYDSNRYTLFGMLRRLDCDVIDMGIVKDQPAALEAALRSACECADAIVTSGGVSAGAADHTRQILAALGDVAFWKLNMRPGRPMAFGKIHSNGHSAVLFGLPGNPVAVMVSFYFFARAALLRMMGADSAPPPMFRVVALDAIRKKRGRTEYQRGILSQDEQGRQQVRITGAQGSGILRSMAVANCMVVLHEHQDHVAAGDLVDIVMFDALV